MIDCLCVRSLHSKVTSWKSHRRTQFCHLVPLLRIKGPSPKYRIPQLAQVHNGLPNTAVLSRIDRLLGLRLELSNNPCFRRTVLLASGLAAKNKPNFQRTELRGFRSPVRLYRILPRLLLLAPLCFRRLFGCLNIAVSSREPPRQ